MTWKYLHKTGENTFWLDHRLTPEVRACLCAWVSRAPLGGVEQRYTELVNAVAGEMFESSGFANQYPDWAPGKPLPTDRRFSDAFTEAAEDALTTYPLPTKAQKFFDDNVAKYGHSSVMELTGSPSVYVQGISWVTAWLLFDSPLCTGQEASTRAIRHKDWPIAREADIVSSGEMKVAASLHRPEGTSITVTSRSTDTELVHLHEHWLSVFEAEVAWWAKYFEDPEHRKLYGLTDKEPFRPALDRARWALPGTVATGCAHTSHLRERSRVLRDGVDLALSDEGTLRVWKEMLQAYKDALPGMTNMGLSEAVYDKEQIPDTSTHLQYLLTFAEDGPDVELDFAPGPGFSELYRTMRESKQYLDPAANHDYQVKVTIRCSLAVARDWHRHRTFYPWLLQVVTDGKQLFLDHHYAPQSDLARTELPLLLSNSFQSYFRFLERGQVTKAAMCLPFGTRVKLQGQAGLRDAVYTFELRHNAVGANFEYKEQAAIALAILDATVPTYLQSGVRPVRELPPAVGLSEVERNIVVQVLSWEAVVDTPLPGNPSVWELAAARAQVSDDAERLRLISNLKKKLRVLE